MIKVGPIPYEMRLDKYLKHKYSFITQSFLEKNLRKGKIKVNNKKVNAGHRLQEDDIINFAPEVCKELLTLNETTKPSKLSLEQALKFINKQRVYEDNNLLVINKPSNLAVQGGTNIKLSIDDIISSIDSEYRLVHRIDRHTSGILLVAKNYNAAVKLTKAFYEKKITKTYIALLEGIIHKEKGTIDLKLWTKKHKKEISFENKCNLLDKSADESILQEAVTHYKLLYNIEDKSLVEFTPETGRMHQLRLHSLELGYPILGDKKYSKDKEALPGKEQVKQKHMYLHAYKLQIPKEVFGEALEFKAPMPEYFKPYIHKDL